MVVSGCLDETWVYSEQQQSVEYTRKELVHHGIAVVRTFRIFSISSCEILLCTSAVVSRGPSVVRAAAFPTTGCCCLLVPVCTCFRANYHEKNWRRDVIQLACHSHCSKYWRSRPRARAPQWGCLPYPIISPPSTTASTRMASCGTYS